MDEMNVELFCLLLSLVS